MQKINDSLYKITCGIVIFFFAYIFLGTTYNLSHMEPLSEHFTGYLTPVFLISGTILLLGLILWLTHLLKKLSSKKRSGILLCLSVCALFLQLFIILRLRPAFQYDTLKPVDTAMYLLNGGTLQNSEFYDYLARNPHNIPFTLYIFCIFKLAGSLGIPESFFMVLLQLLNLILIDSSLAASYCFLKKRMGINVSTGFVLLCILNPLIYYYPTFFYTQVLSFPLTVLFILSFFKALNADQAKPQLLYGSLCAITLFFGYQIRVLTLIALIACLIYLYFDRKKIRLSGKSCIIIGSTFLIVFLVCSFIQNGLITKYSLTTEEAQAMPLQHFIMMGFSEDGEYNYADESFTMSFSTKEERALENTQQIIQRMKDLKFLGTLKLFGKKLLKTWADGYDDYASNLLYTGHHTSLNDWIAGDQAVFLTGYLHIYNCMSWLLILLCALQVFRGNLHGFSYVLCITVLGGMLFHLFWEAGEAYSMPFAGILLMIAALGLTSFSLPSFQHRLAPKHWNILLLCAALALAGTIVFQLPLLTDTMYEFETVCVTQGMLFGDYIYLEDGQTLTQTIVCEKSFNTIDLCYKYDGEVTEHSQILLRLKDSDGQCILSQELALSDRLNTYHYQFEEIVPDSAQIYTLEFTANGLPEGAHGAFAGNLTGNLDIYQEGALYLNGSLIEDQDLYFVIKNCHTATLL